MVILAIRLWLLGRNMDLGDASTSKKTEKREKRDGWKKEKRDGDETFQSKLLTEFLRIFQPGRSENVRTDEKSADHK